VLKPGFFVILTRHPVADDDTSNVSDIVMGGDEGVAGPISATVIEALRAGFRDVTFLALAGSDLADVEPQARVVVVEPRLRDGVEAAAIAAAINLELLSRSD
jgi:hypothetical protein